MSKLARAEDLFADLTGVGWFPVQIKVPRRDCDNTHTVRPFIQDFVFLLYERKGLECRLCYFLRRIVSHESNRRGARRGGGTGTSRIPLGGLVLSCCLPTKLRQTHAARCSPLKTSISRTSYVKHGRILIIFYRPMYECSQTFLSLYSVFRGIVVKGMYRKLE